MGEIADHLHSVRQRIQKAERDANRAPGSVQLLAVSKGQNIAAIESAVAAGQRMFGENYCQEALNKIQALAHYSIEWHFIGTLQANKTRRVAEHFHWVQSVNALRIAERLDRQRPTDLPPLNVCIEVNMSAEVSKTGVLPSGLRVLAEQVRQLPRLRLRGLMVMGRPQDYRQAAVLQQTLIEEGFVLDTLSMGMSGDFEAAIAAGSTMVRIGTALFGARKK